MSTNLQIINTASLDAGMVLASPHVVDEQRLSDAVATVEADGGLTISALRYDSDGNAHVEMTGAEESETYARTYPVGTYVRILVDDCRICGTPGTPVGLECDGCTARAALDPVEHKHNNHCGTAMYYCPDRPDATDFTPRAIDSIEAIAQSLIDGALDNGGATHWVSEQADHGFLVGMGDEDRGLILNRVTPGLDFFAHRVDPSTWTRVRRWVKRSLASWDTHAGVTLGSWFDAAGAFYLDVSDHYASERDAMTACQNRGELAYWDIANNREVQADGSVAAADLVEGDVLDSGSTVVSVERLDAHDETDHTVRVTTDARVHGAAPLMFRSSALVARIVA